MGIRFIAASPSFGMSGRAEGWSFNVTPSGGFAVNDVLHICSEPNNRQIYRLRGLVKTQLGDRLQSGYVWPILFPGATVFRFTSPQNLRWSYLYHRLTYWGV